MKKQEMIKIINFWDQMKKTSCMGIRNKYKNQ